LNHTVDKLNRCKQIKEKEEEIRKGTETCNALQEEVKSHFEKGFFPFLFLPTSNKQQATSNKQQATNNKFKLPLWRNPNQRKKKKIWSSSFFLKFILKITIVI